MVYRGSMYPAYIKKNLFIANNAEKREGHDKANN